MNIHDTQNGRAIEVTTVPHSVPPFKTANVDPPEF
jgi:hypothetical protein